MRYLRVFYAVLCSLPGIHVFLTSDEIGGDYGVGFLAKLRLLIRFYLNTRRIETLSDFREHMELAGAVLRVPKATQGSVVECGCYVGGSTANLSLVCAMTGRKLIVFDSFEGLPEPKDYDRWHHAVHVKHTDVYYKGRFAAPKEIVQRNVSMFGDLSVCEFRVGYYDQTMSSVNEPVVMAFLDVDLIDSLKPCIEGLWPHMRAGCRVYTYEARNLAFVSVYFDQAWWRKVLNEDAPGFVAAGLGLPLGIRMNNNWCSDLGYAQKSDETPSVSPDRDPETLKNAMSKSERATLAKLQDANQPG